MILVDKYDELRKANELVEDLNESYIHSIVKVNNSTTNDLENPEKHEVWIYDESKCLEVMDFVKHNSHYIKNKSYISGFIVNNDNEETNKILYELKSFIVKRVLGPFILGLIIIIIYAS